MVTDLHGVTGRDIMDHLIAGERNPKVLAQLARGRARRKISDLEQALDGAEFFTPEHAALLQAMLARIDQINAKIGELNAVIEQLLAPWEEQLQQAESMPGWGRRSAQDVLAETGPDMTRFATGGHLASWGGRIPLDKQSGKRHGQGRHKKGNKYIGAATGETAVAAGKTQTREGARYRKLARTRGKNKASSPSATPSSRSTTRSCPAPACATRTSARTTTRTARHPPQDRQPRRRDRSPRPRSHPLPQTRAGGSSRSLTQPPSRPLNPTAPPPDATACPAEVLFSAQNMTPCAIHARPGSGDQLGRSVAWSSTTAVWWGPHVHGRRHQRR